MNISSTEFNSSTVQSFENMGIILFKPLMKCCFHCTYADKIEYLWTLFIEFNLKGKENVDLIEINPFTALSKVIED